jgi:hypothetical protein
MPRHYRVRDHYEREEIGKFLFQGKESWEMALQYLVLRIRNRDTL